VPVGRAERFERRRPRVVAAFGNDADTIRRVARVLELMEIAWHDVHGEVTPSEEIVDDVLLCSKGTLEGLVDAAHLAVIDWRDVKVWASEIRKETAGGE
jgi:hypothetical protein